MSNLAKIDRQGNVYWNWKRVSPAELRKHARDGASIVYYFEWPHVAPSAEQIAALEALRNVTPLLVDGRSVPSEWGTLQWFEIEEAPFTMRLAVLPNSPVLFAARRAGDDDTSTWILDPAPEQRAEIVAAIDFLIRANRVVETPPHDPAKAFDPAAQKKSSLHVRISYGGAKRWAAHYASEEIPENLRALQAGCVAYGLEHLATNARTISGADALRFLGRNRN